MGDKQNVMMAITFPKFLYNLYPNSIIFVFIHGYYTSSTLRNLGCILTHFFNRLKMLKRQQVRFNYKGNTRNKFLVEVLFLKVYHTCTLSSIGTPSQTCSRDLSKFSKTIFRTLPPNI